MDCRAKIAKRELWFQAWRKSNSLNISKCLLLFDIADSHNLRETDTSDRCKLCAGEGFACTKWDRRAALKNGAADWGNAGKE